MVISVWRSAKSTYGANNNSGDDEDDGVCDCAACKKTLQNLQSEN